MGRIVRTDRASRNYCPFKRCHGRTDMDLVSDDGHLSILEAVGVAALLAAFGVVSFQYFLAASTSSTRIVVINNSGKMARDVSIDVAGDHYALTDLPNTGSERIYIPHATYARLSGKGAYSVTATTVGGTVKRDFWLPRALESRAIVTIQSSGDIVAGERNVDGFDRWLMRLGRSWSPRE
jgi:hypothetical protein